MSGTAILKSLCAGLAAFAATYVIGAFVAWDFNAGNWPSIGRAVVGLLGAWFSLMAFLFVAEFLDV